MDAPNGPAASWPPPPGPHAGHVADYDPAAGYGTILDDTGASWWFHCTAIADGSRRIEPGTRVSFGLVAGHQGRWEAAGITPA